MTRHDVGPPTEGDATELRIEPKLLDPGERAAHNRSLALCDYGDSAAADAVRNDVIEEIPRFLGVHNLRSRLSDQKTHELAQPLGIKNSRPTDDHSLPLADLAILWSPGPKKNSPSLNTASPGGTAIAQDAVSSSALENASFTTWT